MVEKSNHDLVRIQLGINPHCFDWTLHGGVGLAAPQVGVLRRAVLVLETNVEEDEDERGKPTHPP